jgi:predicted transposase/invertase (TIGR01784 family)
MPRYLDPKNDLVFKKIFGEHPNLLIDFLNALLPLPDDGPVEALECLPPEQVPVAPLDCRRSVVDVKCRDGQGRAFIVEMQMFWTPAFQQRMPFSASQAHVQQIRPGREYRLLQPVYALGLINDVFDKETADWRRHCKIVNVDKPAREIKGLQFVFVEIPKFKPETALDKKIRRLWLRFLKEIEQGEFEPPDELLAYPPTRDALEIAREAAFAEADLHVYQEYLNAIRWDIAVMAERAALALERGREEGRREGAFAEKRAIARNLLDLLDDAAIAAKTGLAVADMARLRQG